MVLLNDLFFKTNIQNHKPRTRKKLRVCGTKKKLFDVRKNNTTYTNTNLSC